MNRLLESLEGDDNEIDYEGELLSESDSGSAYGHISDDRNSERGSDLGEHDGGEDTGSDDEDGRRAHDELMQQRRREQRARNSLRARWRATRGRRLEAGRDYASQVWSTAVKERRLSVAFFFYFVPVTFCLLVTLVVDFPGTCRHPLKAWAAANIAIQMALCVSAFAQHKNENGRMRRGHAPRPFKVQVLRMLKRILFVVWGFWFLLGCIFVFQSRENNCHISLPFLYRVEFAVLLVQLFALSLGVLLLLITSFFFCFRLCFGVPPDPTQDLLGNPAVSNGAAPALIRSLVTQTYKDGLLPEEDRSCAICIMEYEEAEAGEDPEEVKFLPCHHHFHTECIDPWLERNKTCPLCKHPCDAPPPDAALPVINV